MALKQVVIIRKPTTKELETGVEEKLILGPVDITAPSDLVAVARAIQSAEVTTGTPVKIDLSNVEITVKGF
jgi:hypothetical protein